MKSLHIKLLLLTLLFASPFLPQAQESTPDYYIFDMSDFLSNMEKPWSIGNGIDIYTGEFVGPYFEVVVYNGMNMHDYNLEIMNTRITVYGDSINAGQVTKRFEVSDIYFAPTLEVEEVEIPDQLEIVLYPNPASSTTTIEGEYMKRITIYNINGQVVYRSKPKSNKINLNVSNFSSGIYMVQIYCENNRGVFKKLIVK
jgi:hypothetical protein